MMANWTKLMPTLVVSALFHGAVAATLVVVEPPRSGYDGSSNTPIEVTVEPSESKPPESKPLASKPRSQAPETSMKREVVRSVQTAASAPSSGQPRADEPARTRRGKPASAARAVSTPASRSVSPAAPSVPTPGQTTQAGTSLLSMRTRAPDANATGATETGPVNLSPAEVGVPVPSPSPEDRRSPLELPPAPRIPGHKVTRSDSPMVADGNGTYRFDHGGFTAKVERDGRVAFTDKPSIQPFIKGPCLSCVKSDLSRYAEDPSSGHELNLMALLPTIGARFDLTDWVMRRNGDDPYSHAKAKFLDQTREQREQMWHAESEDRLREALQVLPGQLTEIWAFTEWTPEERKRVLFDLWDECAETGPADRVRVGKQIRATIIAFIRRKVPAGGVHQYTRDELDGLNARRASKTVFAPYPGRSEQSPAPE